MASVFENLRTVRGRMDAACRRSGRPAGSVELCAVTKYASDEAAAQLIATGEVADVGESRVQDAAARKAVLEALAPRVRWRMLGHLQKNKARKAAVLFDAFDAVDSLELGTALDRSAPPGRRLPVLAQVNLAGTQTQSGVSERELAGLLTGLRALPKLELQGLMMIAPNLEPVEATRPWFRRLKTIFDGEFGPEGRLSMGMSRDFEVAIEEGATMVRIGSLLFEQI